MDCCGLSLLVVTILTGQFESTALEYVQSKSSLEGATVTLSYSYSKLSHGDYFFWYRQDPGEPPEFLISHLESEEIIKESRSGLLVKVSKKENRVDLLISSAAATDSAVYYCAVRPTVTGNSKNV
uniref:Ig-like domain-containing protein n=1 Tax=Nothobranchius furzeri TaxID=105023 RepID=A0A8C6LS15_NOTFU